MLTGHSLIYFAPREWDGLWRNRHQLMSVFARHNKVLFVERQLYLDQTLAALRQGKLELSDLYRSPVRQISENLFVFRYPVWGALVGRPLFKQLTRTIRRFSLQNTMRKLQMSEPIVWFSLPHHLMDPVKEIPSPRLLLYHVVDEYSAYSKVTPAKRRWIEEQEKKMMTLVDAVIVVSQKLYEAKCPVNPNTHLVPNGVDYQAYVAALADPTLPDDLRVIKPPRLGYSGLVGDRLDFTMLKQLAQENPEWSLVLLGKAAISKQAETWRAMQTLPNVHHLGPVEISQVPHYVKGFQVGLLPYQQSRHAEHTSPLKLYDYLAVGLPVVSVDIPAAREFRQYIHLANSPRDFAQAVRAALDDTSPERSQTRKKVAAQHTWEARVEQLSDLIQAQLDKSPA